MDAEKSPPRTDHLHRLIVAAVAMAGAGLLLFGSNQSKLFGLAYLVILIGLFVVVPALEWVEQRPTMRRAVQRWADRTARVPWLFQAAVGLLGLVLGIYFVLAREQFPGLMSAFFVSLTLLCIVWAIAHRPPPHPAVPAPEASPASRLLGVLLCLAPVVALFVVVVRFSTNAPFYDEYISTLKIANEFDDLSWKQRFAELQVSHFGHRLVLTRALTIAQLKLFGILDFYKMTLFNFAFLVAGALVVLLATSATRRRLLIFAPFALLVFHPQYQQITLWAFGSQHVASFCFIAATLLFVSRATWLGFWLGLASAVAAAYCFASGLFAGLIGLAVLLDQRRFREAYLWLIPITLLEMRYFADLDLESSRAGIALYGLSELDSKGKVLYTFEFLGAFATLGYFSDFLGDTAHQLHDFPAARTLARVIGALIVLVFAYVTFRRYWRVNATVYGLLAIMVVSAALAADQRGHTPNSAFLSRYMINSSLAAATAYLALTQLHPRAFQRLLPVTVTAAVLFCAFSFAITVPQAEKHQRDLQFGTLLAANGLYQHTLPLEVGLPLFQFAQLARAEANDIYRIPEDQFAARFVADSLDDPERWLQPQQTDWTLLYAGENNVAYTFFIGPAATPAPVSTLGIALLDERGSGVGFQALPLAAFTGHEAWMDTFAPEDATHFAVVRKAEVPEGKRRVAIVASLNGDAAIYPTRQFVPTVHATPPALALPSAPRLRLTSFCSDVVIESDEGCWFDRGLAGHLLDVPEDFTLMMLLVPRVNAPGGEVELWRIEFDAEQARPGLKLSLQAGWFALRASNGGDWRDIAKVEAVPGRPNWVAVAANANEVTAIAIDANPSGAIGAVKVGASPNTPTPGTSATLYLGDGTTIWGKSAVQVREVALQDRPITVQDAVANWPLFTLNSQ